VPKPSPIGFGQFGPDYRFTQLTENAFGSDLSDRIGKAWWDHVLDLETGQCRLVWAVTSYIAPEM
jgi:hypothetical protein